MTPRETPPGSARPFGLRPFLAIYLACALALQLAGATPSWGPRSSLEAFSAGLFMMLALLALNLARRARGLRSAFWAASALALVALGLDDFFEVHERLPLASTAGGDLWKVGLWAGAAVALVVVARLERPGRSTSVGMALGFGLHTLYLAAEVGDGGLYELPLPPATTGLLEDLFQLGMLSLYLYAFASLDEAEEASGGSSEPADDFSRAA